MQEPPCWWEDLSTGQWSFLPPLVHSPAVQLLLVKGSNHNRPLKWVAEKLCISLCKGNKYTWGFGGHQGAHAIPIPSFLVPVETWTVNILDKITSISSPAFQILLGYSFVKGEKKTCLDYNTEDTFLLTLLTFYIKVWSYLPPEGAQCGKTTRVPEMVWPWRLRGPGGFQDALGDFEDCNSAETTVGPWNTMLLGDNRHGCSPLSSSSTL